MEIQNKKNKLQKIGDRCVSLAQRHREYRMKFDTLFEQIYGIEFDGGCMDSLVDVLDYANGKFIIEDLEKSLMFIKNNCNFDIDSSKLKNIPISKG